MLSTLPCPCELAGEGSRSQSPAQHLTSPQQEIPSLSGTPLELLHPIGCHRLPFSSLRQ